LAYFYLEDDEEEIEREELIAGNSSIKLKVCV
jgi:hypothetical protein